MYIYVHVFGMRSNKNWFEGVQRIVLGVTCMLSALSIRVHLLKKKIYLIGVLEKLAHENNR